MSERFEILERGRSLRRPSVTAWVRLLRVAQRVERDLGVQLRERWGLNNAQFDVLAHVGVEEGIVQQRLADSLLVTKGNVAQLLDRMEKRGLIERHPEGRTNRLYLTEEGRRLFDEVVPAHEALIAERLSVLSKEEQRHLSEILRKLDHSFDGEPSAVGGL
ncbi:MarR family transcriptional regulator [soil metagenome]|jgi:DNA-binding MarR family transcriptional regulator